MSKDKVPRFVFYTNSGCMVQQPTKKLSIMGQMIILRGQEDSGKTTTIRLLFRQLLETADEGSRLRVWIGNVTIFDGRAPLSSEDKAHIIERDGDFNAILTINGKKIGIVSEGDLACDVEPLLKQLEHEQVDYIICCTRSHNRQGSVYRMIQTKFVPNHPILKVFKTKKYAGGDFLSADEALAAKIAEYVLQILQGSSMPNNQ